jgi:hypothetical protein
MLVHPQVDVNPYVRIVEFACLPINVYVRLAIFRTIVTRVRHSHAFNLLTPVHFFDRIVWLILEQCWTNDLSQHVRLGFEPILKFDTSKLEFYNQLWSTLYIWYQ